MASASLEAEPFRTTVQRGAIQIEEMEFGTLHREEAGLALLFFATKCQR